MSRPYVPLNEQKLLCQISKWTNNLKFRSKDSMTRDKLEMCYLAITLNTYCYQFTKKRCFICLNVCGDPAIMSNDDTILFRQDACLVDRFVCHSCHQSATNIIDVSFFWGCGRSTVDFYVLTATVHLAHKCNHPWPKGVMPP